MRSLLISAIFILTPLASVAQERAASPMVVIQNNEQPQAVSTTPAAAPAAAPAGSAGTPAAAPTAKVEPAPQPVPGKEFPNFPEAAITRVGENTTGQHLDVPATPASPASPAAPASGPAAPAAPGAPQAEVPVSPVSKLWPKDTIQVFMPSCTGLRVQYVKPCTCVITQLMVAMPHDEFLKKSADGTIEQDERLKQIRLDCATAPQKKD